MTFSVFILVKIASKVLQPDSYKEYRRLNIFSFRPWIILDLNFKKDCVFRTHDLRRSAFSLLTPVTWDEIHLSLTKNKINTEPQYYKQGSDRRPAVQGHVCFIPAPSELVSNL